MGTTLLIIGGMGFSSSTASKYVSGSLLVVLNFIYNVSRLVKRPAAPSFLTRLPDDVAGLSRRSALRYLSIFLPPI